MFTGNIRQICLTELVFVRFAAVSFLGFEQVGLTYVMAQPTSTGIVFLAPPVILMGNGRS